MCLKNQSEKIIPDNLERKLHFVLESATPPIKRGEEWSTVGQNPNGGIRASQKKGSVVPCSSISLQRPQRPRDAKGHFLSPSLWVFILMQEV